MAAATAWLMSSAMLMPLDRMRVGISSDNASQTHTPGPIAKKAIKQNRNTEVSQPVLSGGTGVTIALSMCSGAVRDLSRLAKGFLKNAATLVPGTQSSRLMSIVAAGSSDRTTLDAAVKSP